ncbi:unnamed protein product [Albugo candida]|uniref:Uncharacterized protein n=1 Tax=Albugo candida TaxID=65357 RepID=A0A024FXL3_9STRA|nr:unnamed protein product [Albugo candida]|eukprot:CCI11647.1 unnamed protein product [Albugo candida]
MNLVEWDLRCNMVPLHVVHMGTLFKNEFTNKTTTGCSDSDHNHDVLCDHLTPIQSRFDGISTRSDRMIHDTGHSARFEAFADFCCRLKVDALWEKTCAPVLLYSKRGFCNQADLSLQTLPKSSLGKQCLSEDRSCDNPCIHDTAPYTDNKCKTDSVFEEQV